MSAIFIKKYLLTQLVFLLQWSSCISRRISESMTALFQPRPKNRIKILTRSSKTCVCFSLCVGGVFLLFFSSNYGQFIFFVQTATFLHFDFVLIISYYSWTSISKCYGDQIQDMGIKKIKLWLRLAKFYVLLCLNLIIIVLLIHWRGTVALWKRALASQPMDRRFELYLTTLRLIPSLFIALFQIEKEKRIIYINMY
jgi:hypothetical protein